MLVAEVGWPEAFMTVGGAAVVFGLIAVIVWQVFATGRASMAAKREQAYKDLAQ